MMFRLLITGSRSWNDANAIKEQFRLVYAKYGKEVTLVSGNCARGADVICESLARQAGWTVELHPADWKTNPTEGLNYNKKAGPERNQKMVDLGADACLAFIVAGSKGATHCSEQAVKAGIPTKRILSTYAEQNA